MQTIIACSGRTPRPLPPPPRLPAPAGQALAHAAAGAQETGKPTQRDARTGHAFNSELLPGMTERRAGDGGGEWTAAPLGPERPVPGRATDTNYRRYEQHTVPCQHMHRTSC